MSSTDISAVTARSVAGPTTALRDTVSTTTVYIDMSSFIGQPVRISSVDNDVFYCFVGATGTTINTDTDSTGFEDGVADIIWGASSVREVVPGFGTDRKKSWLALEASSSDAVVIVRRA